MTKKIISVILATCMILSCFALSGVSVSAATADDSVSASSTESTGASQGAQSSIQGSAVLHCFNWSYNNIKNNLADIAAAGYTAVQTSPVQQPKDYNASWTDTSGQWWKLYQPLTISVASSGTSWLGSSAELKALCTAADNYGIKVIVDIVANHVANNGTDGGTYSNVNTNVESALKNSSYYHTSSNYINDSNRYTMTQHHMNMPDLNTGNSYIQKRFLQLLKDCVDLGVDGFRFDAAKHIELPTDDASYASDFWPIVINGIKSYKSDVYCYGEILGGAGTDISNYTKYMSVTDNSTGNSALSAVRGNNASSLANSNYDKGAGASKSVLWVESHDTYMEGSSSGATANNIIRTWAIVGARGDSTSLFLARPNASMGAASSDTTWKNTAVAEVNKFKNFFNGTSEYLSSSGSVAYIERGTKGVVISNLNGSGSVSLPAHTMASGTYKDQVSGNTFTVSGGYIKGTVGSTGVAVVYNTNDDVDTTNSTNLSDCYLFGFINGANYACEEDSANMGSYKFVNGKLTTKFTTDSYVAVKTANNEAWFMTDGWLGTDVTSAVLYNTNITGASSNKLYVPGGVTVTFTLVNNGDGSLTLSYTTGTVTTTAATSTSATTATKASTTATTATKATTPSLSKDYYLFGWINGADYACEGDAANMGTYKFSKDGKLTATFTSESYVAVKSANNANWYMTNGYPGNGVTSAILYSTSITGENSNKLQVPGGVSVTFTLVENGDGSLTLSYTTGTVSTTAAASTSATSATSSLSTDYYLFGWINGADYACEGDSANMGTYKFSKDGKLTATFTSESYVAVKSANNANWYMTNGYPGNGVTSAILYSTSITGENSNKLQVPGGVSVTFTLVENGDGSLTLSYVPTSQVTTAPATTVPVTTVPATTVPVTTVPATTVPATTVPVTTVPATTVPATTVPATTVPETTSPEGEITLYAAAPVFAEGTTVDDWCIGYSNDANVTNLTTIEMTKTNREYLLSDVKAGSLKKNVNLAVYKITLTEAQAAAIDASNYVGFMTKHKNIRTNYTWTDCALRANIDKAGYTNTKHKLSEVNGKMFVIDAAENNENKRCFRGNWVSNTGSEIVSTIYAVSPKSAMGDMENVYFRYSTDSNVVQANNIFMVKTDWRYDNKTAAANLSTGIWNVYKLNITAEEAADIDAANYTGFSSPYGASIRTLYNYGGSVTRANVGSYSANYGSEKRTMKSLNGKVFIVADSTGNNTTSYKGYWDDLGNATEIATVTFKVAVPNEVNARAITDVNLIYSDSSDIKAAEKIAAKLTNEKFTPAKNYSTLINASKGWSVYELTLTADQYNEIQKYRYVGFAAKYNYMTTSFTWAYNVLRAGIDKYEKPYDTETTAKFTELDGKTFVICDNVLAKQTSMIGYWA